MLKTITQAHGPAPALSKQSADLVARCMRTPLGAPVPAFAVVYCSNMQYKITAGDVIAVQQLRCTIGSIIALKKVMMVGGPKFTAIGRPFLENARILCDVEENKKTRNSVYVRRPRGRKLVVWRDSNNNATILRVRSIEYDPEIVGELDKYRGCLIDPRDPVIADPKFARPTDVYATETNEFFQDMLPSRY